MLWGDGSRAEGAWLMLPSSISSPLLSAFGISISDLVDDLGGGMAITEHKAEVIGFDTPPHARKGGRKEFFSPRRGTEWWWVLRRATLAHAPATRDVVVRRRTTRQVNGFVIGGER